MTPSDVKLRAPAARGYGMVVVVTILVVTVVAGLSRERWLPQVKAYLTGQPIAVGGDEHAEGGAQPADPHAGHDHGHAEHNESNSIELSEQARKNIGLKLAQIELKPYTRYLSVPGMVVERPGRSTLQVTAPLTGIVTKIYPTDGESVMPGQKLFEIRLTHEELVQVQAELLRTAEELDVIAREITRIEKLSQEGGLAGKTLLERKYEQQKQEAGLRSQQQALVLHGLSPEQVAGILKNRLLLQSLTVTAPAASEPMAASKESAFYQVQELKITQGQQVNAGDSLAVLVDHSELFIAGNAFERDLTEINRAAKQDQPVIARMQIEGQQPQVTENLKILYVANQIDISSRALHFYVSLPNQLEQHKQLADGRKYATWKFRPGQRTQLQVPVETWQDKIVLPVEAVVEEGVEAYVFTPNGDHFDRRTVHVEFKDETAVVVANDGVLFPGDQVAVTAAKQLQLALKNKAGGGIDPHAGHNH